MTKRKRARHPPKIDQAQRNQLRHRLTARIATQEDQRKKELAALYLALARLKAENATLREKLRDKLVDDADTDVDEDDD